jgi:hypothetical protein
METGLKRIEATLDRLNGLNGQENPTIDGSGALQSGPSAEAALTRTVKPMIQPFPLPKQPVVQSIPEPPAMPATLQPSSALQASKQKPARSGKSSSNSKPSNGNKSANKSAASKSATSKSATKLKKSSLSPRSSKATPGSVETVQPFSVQNTGQEVPPLPKPKPPSFSSHRHAANPNLAVGLLKEIETVVVRWQLDLEQTVLEIQALYLEGPIVDGWLESHPYGSPQVMQPIGTATLRHAEIDRLMDYVEEICRVPQTLDLDEVPRTSYRLCGLDADGQLWSRPCPSQQVPYVSLAIARYQKLRILLAKKQTLESRLTQLVQTLTILHSQM